MNQYWSWVLAACGLFGMYLAGKKDPRGWLVGICVQFLWLAYAIATHQWGFLASVFGFGSVYIKNWIAWRRDVRQKKDEE